MIGADTLKSRPGLYSELVEGKWPAFHDSGHLDLPCIRGWDPLAPIRYRTVRCSSLLFLHVIKIRISRWSATLVGAGSGDLVL